MTDLNGARGAQLDHFQVWVAADGAIIIETGGASQLVITPVQFAQILQLRSDVEAEAKRQGAD